MTISIVLIGIILAVFLSYTVLSPLLLNLARFIKRPMLYCPVHATFGYPRLNAFGAALTSGYGEPNLAVKACSLLRKDERCEEVCLKGHEF